MEFWGVEVKPGESVSVKPRDQKYLHISQAALGELKKGKANETVTIFLKVDDLKLVLGTLSAEKFPHVSVDLVFEKEFELSHNGKGASICCLGYHCAMEDYEHEEYTDSDSCSEDEEHPLQHAPNGKPSHKEKSIVEKLNSLKPEATEKLDVKSLAPSKEDEDEDSGSDGSDGSDDSDDSEEDESDDSEDDEGLLDGKHRVSIHNDDGSDSEDDSDSEDVSDSDDDSDSTDEEDGTEGYEEMPKVGSNKKRPNEPASITPVSKKSKLGSAEKSDAKKGGHTGTPQPAKIETPKSGGKFSCKSCDKSFGSDSGLQSHTKAKHRGK